MTCGPALSSSHPEVIPALQATQIAPIIRCGLFDRVCTISSNRHRDARENPIPEKAFVMVEDDEYAAVKPKRCVSAEGALKTAATRPQ